jgi:aspartate racemase
MKTAGIIGGIGPESTVEYYRQIVAAWREHQRDGSCPLIVINSIDLKKMLDLVASDRGALAEYFIAEVRRLARAGADFVAIAANTPHVVFEEIRRGSPIPLLSIVEAVCDTARSLHLRRPLLFGTRFTMQGRFYPDVFTRAGIELVVPGTDDQAFIHDKYMNELVNGVFLPETRQRLLGIVDRLIESDRVDGVILGGTELPLILRETEHRGLPLLDTTSIHVQRIVTEML